MSTDQKPRRALPIAKNADELLKILPGSRLTTILADGTVVREYRHGRVQKVWPRPQPAPKDGAHPTATI